MSARSFWTAGPCIELRGPEAPELAHLGSMNFATPGHLLQRLRVNPQQARRMLAVEQRLKFGRTKLNFFCGVARESGGYVRHFDLLMAPS